MEKPSEAQKVIFRYLINGENPSSLAASFPWVKANALSLAYEKGKGWEGEFVQSWEFMLVFLHDFDPRRDFNLAGAIAFFEDLASRGFNKTLRAGSSLLLFILSRSRRNGLRQGQVFISFSFSRDGSKMMVKKNEEKILEDVPIGVTDEILELLRELEKEEID